MKWEVLTSILLGWTGIWQDVSPMVSSIGLGKHIVFARILHVPQRAYSVVTYLNIEQRCIIGFLIHIVDFNYNSWLL